MAHHSTVLSAPSESTDGWTGRMDGWMTGRMDGNDHFIPTFFIICNIYNNDGMDEMSVRLDDGTDSGDASVFLYYM